jgi:phospholipase C
MRRVIPEVRLPKRFASIAFVAACLAVEAIAGCGSSPGATQAVSSHSPPPPSPTPSPMSKIKHVVIIVQENRSTDDLFNGFPGADTVTSGSEHGTTVPLHASPLEAKGEFDHSHGGFIASYDSGLMDGWPNGTNDTPFVYVPPAETTPIWSLAEQFGFGDRMFQSNQGPSYPAHLYLFVGTSSPADGSTLLASENPGDPTHTHPLGGCDSLPDMRVTLIDPSGSEAYHEYPCFEHQTIVDLLDAHGLSWTYYEPDRGGFWDGPSSIKHVRDNPNDWARVVTPETTILSDIAGGKLANVSWVIPDGLNSDHPGNGSKTGPSWVASIANAIGASGYWSSTAIFVTWDDWGGVYDHVPPPIYGSYELGFRVPLIVASPYAKPGYVSHTQHEFGSILHFVEDVWGLGSLGYTDARADDLSDFFDFKQAPLPYHQVPAQYSRTYFERSRFGHNPPDDD